jgi:hypothetical protein
MYNAPDLEMIQAQAHIRELHRSADQYREAAKLLRANGDSASKPAFSLRSLLRWLMPTRQAVTDTIELSTQAISRLTTMPSAAQTKISTVEMRLYSLIEQGNARNDVEDCAERVRQTGVC